jgi:hypothetical protein
MPEMTSTLPLRVSDVPRPFVGLGRVISVVVTVIDVLYEAQEQAIAAQKRYPSIDW